MHIEKLNVDCYCDVCRPPGSVKTAVVWNITPCSPLCLQTVASIRIDYGGLSR
jgi:hypothetical protein